MKYAIKSHNYRSIDTSASRDRKIFLWTDDSQRYEVKQFFIWCLDSNGKKDRLKRDFTRSRLTSLADSRMISQDAISSLPLHSKVGSSKSLPLPATPRPSNLSNKFI